MTPSETALAKQDPVGSALAKFQPENYNILVPISKIDRIPEMYRLSIREVKVDPETETYPIPGEKAKVALTKVALDKIAMAAGIQWIPNECYREDDRKDPHLVTYRVAGVVRDFDGNTRVIGPSSKTVDLRGEPAWPVERLGTDTREFLRVAEKKEPTRWDIPAGTKGSECKDCKKQIFWIKTQAGKNVAVDPSGLCHFDTCEAKAQKGPAGWDRVYQARQHILSLAESKAKTRCIRESQGLPSGMTKEQAAKPFVVATLVLAPDMNDPDWKAAAIQHVFGAGLALYGPSRPLRPVAPAPEASSQVIDAEITEHQAGPSVDDETGEILEPGQPVSAPKEPWDESPTPKPLPVPIPRATIDANPDRANAMRRVNELVQDFYDRRGADEITREILAEIVSGFDPVTAPMSQFAKVAEALRAPAGR